MNVSTKLPLVACAVACAVAGSAHTGEADPKLGERPAAAHLSGSSHDSGPPASAGHAGKIFALTGKLERDGRLLVRTGRDQLDHLGVTVASGVRRSSQ